jgi:hypothetical protein
MYSGRNINLARADVQTNRAGVVVLEVVESKVASGAHLIRDLLTRGAVARCDEIRVARRDGQLGELALLVGLVGVRSVFVGGFAQLGEAGLAAAGDGVAGCHEIFLLGE